MIHLGLLGPLELRGADGVEVAAVLKQPKRLALLAYLAAAAPHRFHRRDSLLAMFWPELDESHARSALRRALYFLRRELGSEVIASRGDEIATASGVVWCDVAAFRDAMRAGRDADALELYRGDLLAGFFAESAPEFERWLDLERNRLRAQASEGAWRLAQGAERSGNARQAVRWARQAAALTPEDEAAMRRLIALLDSVGDRAGALQAYDELVRRLADALDVAPSPETQALIETVRSRAAHDVAQPTPGETRPNLMAVLPFTVRGTEELGYLREGMVDLLSAKLDRAGEFGTVDPRASLRYVQALGTGDVDRQLARTVARHFRAGQVILGTVVAAGGRLHISAALYSAETGDDVRADVEADGETELLAAVDRLVLRLLAQRPASFGGRMARLAAVTTDSLTALKAYLVGERAFRGGQYADAMAAFEGAVDEDPAFALAHYRLGATYAAMGLVDAARAAAQNAWEHRRSLTSHTQLLLEAQREWLAGHAEAAEARSARVVSIAPDSVDGWYLLGDIGFRYNPLRGRSVHAARAPLERTLALDPRHLGALNHLIRLAALERDTGVLEGRVEQYLRLQGAPGPALAVRAVRAFVSDDPSAQEQVWADLRRGDAAPLAAIAADVALYTRNAEMADKIARLVLERAPPPAVQVEASLLLAHLAAARRDGVGATRELASAAVVDAGAARQHRALLLSLPVTPVSERDLAETTSDLETWKAPPPPSIERYLRSYLLGLLALRQGDAERALRHAAACEQLEAPPDVEPLRSALAKGLEARVAFLRGDPARAVALLDTPRHVVWHERGPASAFLAQPGERFLRGQALLALGRSDEAVGWLEGLGQGSPYELVYVGPARNMLNQIGGVPRR